MWLDTPISITQALIGKDSTLCKTKCMIVPTKLSKYESWQDGLLLNSCPSHNLDHYQMEYLQS